MPQNASRQAGTHGTAGLPETSPRAASIRLEPSAIPGLVETLRSSLDAVGVQIGHAITELRIQPWAGDPVSTSTAERFNEHAVSGDHAALDALHDYRDRLQAAAEALHTAGVRYQHVDEANAERLNQGC